MKMWGLQSIFQINSFILIVDGIDVVIFDTSLNNKKIEKTLYRTELYHVYNYKLELRHFVRNKNFPKILADSISPKQKYQVYEE